MIRAVLFDVDDTLTDYAGSERAAIEQYLRVLGVDVPGAADVWHTLQEEHFGRYLAGEVDFAGQCRARAAAMARWLGVDCPDPDDWFAGYRTHYEAALVTFDDVVTVLDEFIGLRLGVVSNNDESYVRRKLARLGLLDRFDCVFGADSIGVVKPDPAVFLAACSRLGVAPAEAVYVGDRVDVDARAANAAGLLGVWLDRAGTGTAPDVLRITSLAELPGALERVPDLGSREVVG